jgi:hypothetical protein
MIAATFAAFAAVSLTGCALVAVFDAGAPRRWWHAWSARRGILASRPGG